MKYKIIIIAFIYSFVSYSQTNISFKKGSVHEIKGLIIDNTTNDNLTGVVVEFMDEHKKWIDARVSDFDGQFFFKICSKKLINKTLFIKTTQAFYKQEIFKYKITSDTVLKINMAFDKKKVFSKKEFEKYKNSKLYFECSINDDFDEIEYWTNKKVYQHYCTGEQKKYKGLIDDKEDFSEWNLIKKSIISYPPELLKSFKVSRYKFIDNIQVTLNLAGDISNYKEYTKVVRELLLKAGWDGSGKIRVLWIPAFVLKRKVQNKYTKGVFIWYVQQKSEDMSWILSPVKI